MENYEDCGSIGRLIISMSWSFLCVSDCSILNWIPCSHVYLNVSGFYFSYIDKLIRMTRWSKEGYLGFLVFGFFLKKGKNKPPTAHFSHILQSVFSMSPEQTGVFHSIFFPMVAAFCCTEDKEEKSLAGPKFLVGSFRSSQCHLQ